MENYYPPEKFINKLKELEKNSEGKESNKEDDDDINVMEPGILMEKGKEESKPKNQDNEYKIDIFDLIQNNIQQPTSILDQLPEGYIFPQENKYLEKQSEKDFENTEYNLISKKTTRENTNEKKNSFYRQEIKIRRNGKLSNIKSNSSRKRKLHNNKTIDDIMRKIKSFTFKTLILFLNQFLKHPLKGKKKLLHHIRREQATNCKVDFNKELMKKQLKIILSDTKNDYNKNLLNDLSKNQEIKSLLELKLEDIFNYLKNNIEIGIIETNKIFKIIKIKNKNNSLLLDFLFFYLNRLNKRKNAILSLQTSL